MMSTPSFQTLVSKNHSLRNDWYQVSGFHEWYITLMFCFSLFTWPFLLSPLQIHPPLSRCKMDIPRLEFLTLWFFFISLYTSFLSNLLHAQRCKARRLTILYFQLQFLLDLHIYLYLRYEYLTCSLNLVCQKISSWSSTFSHGGLKYVQKLFDIPFKTGA